MNRRQTHHNARSDVPRTVPRTGVSTTLDLKTSGSPFHGELKCSDEGCGDPGPNGGDA